MKKYFATLVVLLLTSALVAASGDVTISGELKIWHKITLSFEGPESAETADPNPFTDYRLNVTFTHGTQKFTVPGYFAADGDAANTSAESGNVWRVHFAPNKTGQWKYEVSFRKGKNIAVDADADAGQSAGFMDGKTGTFEVGASDKFGRDNRARGRLEYVGERYLRFAGSGEYFLKAGADAPENLLAFVDFDGNFKEDGHNDRFIKTWDSHVKDWKPGDPTWGDGKGKGLIGAINYLAGKGMNVFSFLTLNIEGDDGNVFPYIDYGERLRMDCSKLDQWEIVFEHGDRLGMYLHFKTQEVENQNLLDNGEVGLERKLYYRELIARFSHHLALNWNLGEENGKWGTHEKYQTTEQRKAMAQYFWDTDPYHHLIVIHNGQPFDDLLGPDSKLTGVSVQTHKRDFSQVHNAVLHWIDASADAGKQWVVACDEPGDASHALVTDAEDPGHDLARKNALWGVLMAGGAGIEWYFGYQHPHSDLTCQDWRSRDKMWDQCRYALDFFRTTGIPFWQMKNSDGLSSNPDSYCFSKEGEIYLVYLKKGGTTQLDLSGTPNRFFQRWYNPRDGLFYGQPTVVNGGAIATIGEPITDKSDDWLVWLQRLN